MSEDPYLAARKLRNQLRQLRIAKEMTQRQVAEQLYWSASKVIRIESGSVRVSITDCRALLQLLDAPEHVEREALALAQAARRPSEFERYAHLVAPEFLLFMAQEVRASEIATYQPHVVPGHLQTQEYASEVLANFRGSIDASRISDLLELRTHRQMRLFSRAQPPAMRFMVDESVIRRQVGGPEVMNDQLRHLLELMELPFIDLRVVPFRIGMYRGLRLPFVVLQLDDPAEADLLYLEHTDGGRVVRPVEVHGPDEAGGGRPTDPAAFQEIYAELEALTSRDETAALIGEAMVPFGLRRGAGPHIQET